MLTFGSLFAGIGGMDLGLERAGFECKLQVEIDPFCRKVLAKHWPNVPKHDDVRTFPSEDIERYRVDLIAGGFPCQDVSHAGHKSGINGERSGLYRELIRILRLLRPRFALIENVSALTVRGMGSVLADLAQSGFDAEWECLPASAFGAVHDRDRIFICAYCQGSVPGVFTKSRGLWEREFQSRRLAGHKAVQAWPGQRFEGEPDLAVLVHGIPDRLGRYGLGKALGNSVYPDVAEWIGRRIIESCPELNSFR